MNVFIAGGGHVGFHLARLLCAENHDVTVIESDATRLEQVDYALDASTVLGNAASALQLQAVGVGEADLFVALSGSDEINLVAATAAKGMGAKVVVARVQDPVYIESSFLYETIMGIDYILSPDALTAREISTYIEEPGVLASDDFGRGLVRMRQLRVTKSPTTDGKTLKDIQLPSQVLVCLLVRHGEITVPHGDAIIEPGDLVTLVGQRDMMDEVNELFQGTEAKAEKVVIMGGNSVGLHLAQNLEQRIRTVKLFDWNLARCHELAAKLKKVKVVCRDATSRLTLEQEHVEGADFFVSTTRDDARNILAAVLAKEIGAKRSIAVVHQYDFAPLVGKLGIDHAVTPRACLANRILKLVHEGGVSSLSVLEEGQVEILEIAVEEHASVAGKPLADIAFPEGALAATILRGDKVIVPRGDDTILEGDSVIVILKAEALEAVKKLFQR